MHRRHFSSKKKIKMHCFSLLGMKFDKNANELESKIAITKAESI